METEDVVELGLIAVIVIALGYVIVKALGFLGDSGVPQGIGTALNDATAPVTTAEQTLLGDFSSAPSGQPSNSSLLYGALVHPIDALTNGAW